MQEYTQYSGVEKDIGKISPLDAMVSVIGIVITKGDDHITIDDGTGSVKVYAREEQLEKINEKDLVRVIGLVRGTEIMARVVTNINKLDIEKYKTVRELWNKSLEEWG